MMKKPSSSALALTGLWVIYGVVATYVFYQAMEPLKRELMGILGGFALVLVVATALLFTPTQRRRFFDADSSGSMDDQELSCPAAPKGDQGLSGKPSASRPLEQPAR